jgi:hypothetical protein
MTDLSNFVPKTDTVEVILKNPRDGSPILKEDGTEMSITVYGSHTQQYRDAIHAQSDARMERAAKTKNGDMKLKSKDIETFSIELAASITESWDIVLEGKTPPIKDAKKIYTTFPWLRAQVLESADDFEGFTKA